MAIKQRQALWLDGIYYSTIKERSTTSSKEIKNSPRCSSFKNNLFVTYNSSTIDDEDFKCIAQFLELLGTL